MGDKVAVLRKDIEQSDDWDFDPFIQFFAQGAGYKLSTLANSKDTNDPLILRGVGGGSRKAILHCWETGRDFYIIDTGYFGNWKHKTYHRITKNNLQNLGPILPRPIDRLVRTGWKYKEFTPGKNILICPPSEKVMQIFKQPSPNEWTQTVIKEIRRYTNRPIAVRLKPSRTERVSNKTIQDALADNVHCLVTYNSIAAVEALMEGKPAIALGPNAAQVMCNTELKDVEHLRKHDKMTMERYMAHLAYCHFTEEEMRNGYAWRILQETYA